MGECLVSSYLFIVAPWRGRGVLPRQDFRVARIWMVRRCSCAEAGNSDCSLESSHQRELALEADL